MRGTKLHRNLRGNDKNPGSTNKYAKFCQLIIIKIIATRCHISGADPGKYEREAVPPVPFLPLLLALSALPPFPLPLRSRAP